MVQVYESLMTKKNSVSYLEIRFHLSDGAVEHFFQPDEPAAQKLLDRLEPSQLFKQPRIIIAGDYSTTVFVPAHLTKVDFICKDFVCWEFPTNLSDVVEISEALFGVQQNRARRNSGARPRQKTRSSREK